MPNFPNNEHWHLQTGITPEELEILDPEAEATEIVAQKVDAKVNCTLCLVSVNCDSI